MTDQTAPNPQTIPTPEMRALMAAVQPPQAPASPVVAPAATPQPAATAGPVAAVSEAVNPSHYTRFKIQPITFIRENNLPFWQANVVKYVVRADAKNGLEDIEKAIDYLMKERAYLRGDPAWFDVRWVAPEELAK